MKPTYIVQYWNAGKWNTEATYPCSNSEETWNAAADNADQTEKELIKQGYEYTRILMGF